MFLEYLENRQYFNIILDRVNEIRADPIGSRAKYGLSLPDQMISSPRSLLKESNDLDNESLAWATYLRDNQIITHVGPDGSVPLDRAKNFNVSIVYNIENAAIKSIYSSEPNYLEQVALGIQENFIASDDHFWQLEDNNVRLFGSGYVTGYYGNFFCIYFVEELGTIEPSIPDSNNDGIINNIDFTIMGQNFGSKIVRPNILTSNSINYWNWELGDYNDDNVINALDFNYLSNSY
jgi:hypothetical protein